jgi:hypothetical protein
MKMLDQRHALDVPQGLDTVDADPYAIFNSCLLKSEVKNGGK